MRGRRRGPTPRPVDPRVKQLEVENRRLQRKLQRAETIMTLQKKGASVIKCCYAATGMYVTATQRPSCAG